jgi:hypothetical protein
MFAQPSAGGDRIQRSGVIGPEDILFDGLLLPQVDEERLLASGTNLVLGYVEEMAPFWEEHGGAGWSAAPKLHS